MLGSVRSVSSGVRVNDSMHGVGKVRRVLPPEREHRAAVLVARAVPVRRVAVEAIGQLLPHEGRCAAGRRLARIEQRRARAPHHGRRDRAGLVMAHDVAELVEVVEAHDHHEGLRQFGMRVGRPRIAAARAD